jgi:hypothetical protein
VTARRFSATLVEQQDTCFVVRDHNGQQLANVYFEDEQRLGPMLEPGDEQSA